MLYSLDVLCQSAWRLWKAVAACSTSLSTGAAVATFTLTSAAAWYPACKRELLSRGLLCYGAITTPPEPDWLATHAGGGCPSRQSFEHEQVTKHECRGRSPPSCGCPAVACCCLSGRLLAELGWPGTGCCKMYAVVTPCTAENHLKATTHRNTCDLAAKTQ